MARAFDNVDNQVDSASVTVTVSNGSSLMGSSSRGSEPGDEVADTGDSVKQGSDDAGGQAGSDSPKRGHGRAHCGKGGEKAGHGTSDGKQHGGKAKQRAGRAAHGKASGRPGGPCKARR